MLPGYVRLPRNFQFFKRLPARFMMQVLEPGNQTDKGRWYKVTIKDQVLNVLSKEPLKPGQMLEIEKQSSLKLKVLRELNSEQLKQSLVHDKTGGDEAEPLREGRSLNADKGDWLYRVANLADFFDALALVYFEENADVSFGPGSANYYFEWKNDPPLKGVFVPLDDGRYDLFLGASTLEKAGYYDTGPFRQLLSDLPVRRVATMPDNQLKGMFSGIDLLG